MLISSRSELPVTCHLGLKFKYCIWHCALALNNIRNLMIIDSEKIDWKWFECTKKVQFLGLLFLNESPNHRKKVISLDILLGNMPRICGLSLDGFFLKVSENHTKLQFAKFINLIGNSYEKSHAKSVWHFILLTCIYVVWCLMFWYLSLCYF